MVAEVVHNYDEDAPYCDDGIQNEEHNIYYVKMVTEIGDVYVYGDDEEDSSLV